MNTFKYFVEGMHCKACELYIEKKLSKIEEIKNVNADLVESVVTIESNQSINIDKLNNALADSEYKIVSTKKAHNINHKELFISFIYAVIIVTAFIALQKAGIVNVISAEKITLPTVFLIGIVASLSSCMAVVGGLVLSISSVYAKYEKNKSIFPLTTFHVSRIVSFFILGGIIGQIGATAAITPAVNFFLSVLLFIVMLSLGINLLEIIPFFIKIQFTMPKFITKNNKMDTNIENKYTPALLGFLTFFLPCGFTQSMQFYTLTTGTFFMGSLTMLVYALGTLPVLIMVSIASIKFSKGIQSKIFFRTAGFLILFFAIINFLSALTSIGVIRPLFNF